VDSFSRLLDVFFHESTLGMMIFLILDDSVLHYSLHLFYDSIEKLHRNSMAVDIQTKSCALSNLSAELEPPPSIKAELTNYCKSSFHEFFASFHEIFPFHCNEVKCLLR